MKPFGLSLGTLLLRYYLMMMVIIAAGFIGQWWLAFLALPIFLSTILGVSFEKNEKGKAAMTVQMNKKEQSARKAS